MSATFNIIATFLNKTSKVKPKNKIEAWKIDTSFYADEEDNVWYTFGNNSGFAYSSFASEKDAEKEVDRLEKSKKEHRGIN